MIVLLDNYDSFTYNLYQILAQYEEVKIFRNDKITLKEIEKISNEEDCIVIVGHGCSLYALIKTILKDEKITFPGNASAYILCKKNNEYKLEKYLRL